MSELVPPVIPAGRLCEQAQPRLRVDGLALRPWVRDDVPTLIEAYSDPAIQQWHARSMDEAEAETWIDERSERWSAEVGVDWAVLVDGVAVGRVGFRELKSA